MLETTDKNIDIQVLRAVACMAVVFQHLNGRIPTPNWYSNIFNHALFWPGVDIFFAISGYLICKTFCNELLKTDSKGDALNHFWRKRVARLMPTLLFWLAASIAISFITTSTPSTDPYLVARSAISAVFGLSNIYWASCVNLNLACGSGDYNAVTWTLSLEWQLYAVSTLLIAFVGIKRYLFAMLIISVAISTLNAPNFSFPAVLRPQAFFIGSLVFFTSHKLNFIKNRIACNTAFIAGLLTCFLAPIHIPQPFTVPAISLGAGLCLLSAMPGNSLSNILPKHLLSWVGERSYSIYLCHLPALLLVRELMTSLKMTDPTLLNFSLSLMLAVAFIGTMGDLSFRKIEQPMKKILSPTRIAQTRL